MDRDGAGSGRDGKGQRFGEGPALSQASGQCTAEGIPGAGHVDHVHGLAGGLRLAVECLGAVRGHRAHHPADFVVADPPADASHVVMAEGGAETDLVEDDDGGAGEVGHVFGCAAADIEVEDGATAVASQVGLRTLLAMAAARVSAAREGLLRG
jgi:hypothetical protein